MNASEKVHYHYDREACRRQARNRHRLPPGLVPSAGARTRRIAEASRYQVCPVLNDCGDFHDVFVCLRETDSLFESRPEYVGKVDVDGVFTPFAPGMESIAARLVTTPRLSERPDWGIAPEEAAVVLVDAVVRWKVAADLYAHADRDWQAALVEAYGKDAGDARYDQRGRATPELQALDAKRVAEQEAWLEAGELRRKAQG